MRVAFIILSLLGALWAFFALWALKAPSTIYVGTAALSAAMLLVGWKIIPQQGAQPHHRKIVRTWSMIEGALMLLTVVVLRRFSAQDYIPAIFSMIVGLHFFPLAHGFPQPLYYWTGSALTAVGTISTALPSARLQLIVPSCAGALILGGSAIALIISARRQTVQ